MQLAEQDPENCYAISGSDWQERKIRNRNRYGSSPTLSALCHAWVRNVLQRRAIRFFWC